MVPLDKEEGVLDWNFDPRKPEIIEVGKTVSVYLKFLSSMAWVMPQHAAPRSEFAAAVPAMVANRPG